MDQSPITLFESFVTFRCPDRMTIRQWTIVFLGTKDLVVKQSLIVMPGFFLFYYWGGQVTVHEFEILRLDGITYPETWTEANAFSIKDALAEIEKHSDKDFKVFRMSSVSKHIRNLLCVPEPNPQKPAPKMKS